MYLFYSLISISILSTIHIFNQYVNNYSQMYNNSLFLSSDYESSNQQKIDNEFFIIIKELDNQIDFNNLNNKNICEVILRTLQEKSNPKVFLSRFKIASKTKSMHFKFKNSCALSDGNHRIVFIKNNYYESIPTLHSCKTSTSSYCKFENDSSF